MKIINIAARLASKKNKWAADAMKALENSGDPNGIIKLILFVIRLECEVGLGLIDDEDFDDLSLEFFHQIHDIYQKAAGDCYFCKDIDPNEIRFDKDTQLCITCKQKMANFLRAIGIDPGKILFGA